MRGAPAVLWVAHLDANKDPLTVLDGVARASAVLPDLQLWCCFRDAPLLEAVKDRRTRDAVRSVLERITGKKVPEAAIETPASAPGAQKRN